MVDKLLSKAKKLRGTWWEAFTVARGVKGHQYYDIPKEIKYRYPAPGSCPLDKDDHPNLYKRHWKTPFRDSNYNIRPIEKQYTMEENTIHAIMNTPTIDPQANEAERRLSLQQNANMDHLEVVEDGTPADSEDKLQEMWDSFEAMAEHQKITGRDFAPWTRDLDDDYNQVNHIIGGYEKDYSGMANDWKSRKTVEELEYMIENIIGEKRIKEQKFKMYKG